MFGEVWSRQDKLSLSDRSLITVIALMAKGILDNSLKYHIMNAKKNSITKEKFAEAINVAFYAGWPNTWTVFNMAKEIYEEE